MTTPAWIPCRLKAAWDFEKQNTRIPRAHSGVEPPVPIPNTEVKRASADGTGTAGSWESRSVRGIFTTRRVWRVRE